MSYYYAISLLQLVAKVSFKHLVISSFARPRGAEMFVCMTVTFQYCGLWKWKEKEVCRIIIKMHFTRKFVNMMTCVIHWHADYLVMNWFYIHVEAYFFHKICPELDCLVCIRNSIYFDSFMMGWIFIVLSEIITILQAKKMHTRPIIY